MIMLATVFYLILAIFGLGFLIFIHELGHYLVARHLKMKVEVFSIGFGPALCQWTFHNVQWKLCIFPFGGYVKIAEMEKEQTTQFPNLSNTPYKKTAWKMAFDRIKVAAAGPLANIIFAFLSFSIIWICGGQKKPFQEYTNIIGYVDPQSPLYLIGLRAGDEITLVNNKPIHGYRDIAISMLMKKESIKINGNTINYFLKKKEPFSITIPIHKNAPLDSIGISLSQYLMFNSIVSDNAPIADSGIKKGDRIVWVNGHLIFSQPQLSSILNDSKTLLTIKRGDNFFLTQVPMVEISHLRLQTHQKNDLEDWKHAANILSKTFYFIPYEVNYQGRIEKSLSFMNDNSDEVLPSMQFRNPLSLILRPGDQIVAVNGTPIANGIEFLSAVQKKQAVVIIQRGEQGVFSEKDSDKLFEDSFNTSSLKNILGTIGKKNTTNNQENNQDLILLPTITLKKYADLHKNKKNDSEESKIQKAIEKISNPQEREEQFRLWEKEKNKLLLGAQLQDQLISFNPPPTTLFSNAFDQIWQPLLSIFSGTFNSKNICGAIGVVQGLQKSWSSSCQEAFFWLGVISLNLAIFNLLPLPILDGGLILFAIIEYIRKKPINPKIMEKIILPFVALMVLLFIYTCYQDIIRIAKNFF